MKKVEKRVIEIRFADICRFTKEINQLRPIHDRLIFLDEMALDSPDILRKRGWFLRGSCPTFSVQCRRSQRISILAFLGIRGFFDVFQTENKFDRTRIFSCIKKIVNDELIKKGSEMIMDGAKIHLDKNIVNYLRSNNPLIP